MRDADMPVVAGATDGSMVRLRVPTSSVVRWMSLQASGNRRPTGVRTQTVVYTGYVQGVPGTKNIAKSKRISYSHKCSIKVELTDLFCRNL